MSVVLPLLGASAILGTSVAKASEPTPAKTVLVAVAAVEDLDALDIESLLELRISTVSKHEEPLFEALLSATVLTRKEIQSSGAANLCDALRLIPGLIVRVPSQGGCDVHIRGFDAIPPMQVFSFMQNRKTLVMIDHRIEYNEISGTVHWQAPPLSIDEVESIEVVRGPISALYGANAAAGVIHIKTHQPSEAGWTGRGNLRLGSAPWTDAGIVDGRSGSIEASYKAGGVWARASAFVFRWDRHRHVYAGLFPGDIYNDISDMRYVDGRSAHEATVDINDIYDFELASRGYGLNTVLHYELADDRNVTFRAGMQDAFGHSPTGDFGITVIAPLVISSHYAQVRGQLGAATAQLVYWRTPHSGLTQVELDGDVSTWDGTLQYQYAAGALSLRPELHLRSVASNDSPLLGGRQGAGWRYIAPSMQATVDLSPVRLTAASRVEIYEGLELVDVPVQIGATLGLGDEHLLRLVYGRAYQTPSLLDHFADVSFHAAPVVSSLRGTPGLRSMRINAVELGYRGAATIGLQWDVEFFAALLDHLSTLEVKQYGTPITVGPQPIEATARMLGATAQMRARWKAIHANVFVTAQTTRINDYALDYYMAPDRLLSGEAPSTPKAYGGFGLRYTGPSSFTASINGYFFTEQKFWRPQRTVPMVVKGNALIDVTLCYPLVDGLTARAGVRNLLNMDQRQYPLSDRLPIRMWVDLSLEH